jgi:hypothetical protein
MINAPVKFTPQEKEAYKQRWYPRTTNDKLPDMIDASPIHGLSKSTAYTYINVVNKIKQGYTLQEACQIFSVIPANFNRACKNHPTLRRRLEEAENSLVLHAETALKQSALGLAQDVQEIYDVDEEGKHVLKRKIVTTQKPDVKAINKILSNLAPEKWNKDRNGDIITNQNYQPFTITVHPSDTKEIVDKTEIIDAEKVEVKL